LSLVLPSALLRSHHSCCCVAGCLRPLRVTLLFICVASCLRPLRVTLLLDCAAGSELVLMLDLCFALMCTPIGKLHLHHFVFFCSMLAKYNSVSQLRCIPVMSLMWLLRRWSYADFQPASAGLKVDVHSRLRGSANASLSHSLLRAL